MSLATKYRPSTFAEVVGQEITIKLLTKQLETNSFVNCYLFAGPSGDGKTTIARIMANEINKHIGNPIEIDGASNNGVDNIRMIINEANSRSLTSEYKIFIMDEVHMLTTASWNALLKLIEEPPKYTIFMFCTTDPQKIPQTILNRCMRFDLQKINQTDIANRLAYICEQENVVVNDDQSLDYIAKISDGCMRDAISKLEKVINLSNVVSIDSVVSVLGSADYNTYFNLVDYIVDNNSAELLKEIDNMSKLSLSIKTICTNMILFVLDLTKYAIFKSTDVLSYIPKIFEDKIKYSTGVRQTQQEVIDYFNTLLQKVYTLKDVQDINTFEIVLLGIMNEVSKT